MIFLDTHPAVLLFASAGRLPDVARRWLENEPVVLPPMARLELNWTRDPFDRLIAAHAMVWSAPLVTKDAAMHQHYPLAFWDQPPGGP